MNLKLELKVQVLSFRIKIYHNRESIYISSHKQCLRYLVISLFKYENITIITEYLKKYF